MVRGLVQDRSGTVAVANTYQQLAPLNFARHFLFIQAGASPLTVKFGTSAAVSIPANSTLRFDNDFIPCDAVTITSTSAGAAFTALEG